MASPGPAWTPPNGQRLESAEQPPLTDQDLKRRVQESIQRLWFWIQGYVQRSDPGASTSDFADRIERRACRRLKDNPDALTIDETVKNIVKLLVYEDRRAAQRRTQTDRFPSIDGVEDPDSLHFLTEIEVESQMEVIRKHVSPEQLSILQSLYGFEEEELTVGELAKNLGMQPTALYQKIHRLYAKLRRELGSRVTVI